MDKPTVTPTLSRQTRLTDEWKAVVARLIELTDDDRRTGNTEHPAIPRLREQRDALRRLIHKLNRKALAERVARNG